MHELSLVAEIVEIARTGSKGAQVKRIRLEIGELAAVVPDALRFCFDLASEDTCVHGAQLDIVMVPGEGLRVKSLEVV